MRNEPVPDRNIAMELVRVTEAAAGAAERLGAEERLEGGERAAHGALRDRELGRRAGEALVPGRGFEGGERGCRWDLASHRVTGGFRSAHYAQFDAEKSFAARGPSP